MKYRYLDLRQPYLQNNIRLRSKVSKAIRDFLHGKGFSEIETRTPHSISLLHFSLFICNLYLCNLYICTIATLFKSTPEGAREFLVATRIPGKFYRSMIAHRSRFSKCLGLIPSPSVLQSTAVASTVQTASHDVRIRALLPDCTLLSRRERPQGSSA